ncbi:zinc-type alcohol dehydrogenase-like protein C1773.06c [Sergentomyia squamirostris]
MNKLCRQVSIESPGPVVHDCVFSFSVPIPETPPGGVRVKVVCAGACYRSRRSLASSTEDTTSSPAHHGVRDSALFAGFEVAGVVEEVDDAAEGAPAVGERVVVYPFDGCPQGYAEYVSVPDPKCVIPLPASVPLSVAAMLPSGALRALNTIKVAQQTSPTSCKLLVVGTGGLALWTVRIAQCIAPKMHITVASLRDEGLQLAQASK